MSNGETINFKGEMFPTFTERGFISILSTFCGGLEKFSLEPVETVEGTSVKQLREGLDLPFMKGVFKPYRMDKCEKLCITNCILMDRILVSGLIAFPADDYDFPMLTLEWSETEDVISVLVDLVPVADPVITAGYRETYLDPLEEYWTQYVELPWIKPNRFAWSRMVFSPYYLSGSAPKGQDQNKKDCLDIVSQYLGQWIRILEKAEPITDEQQKQAVKARKDAMRRIFRANDEGAKTMKQMVGEDIIKMLLLSNF